MTSKLLITALCAALVLLAVALAAFAVVVLISGGLLAVFVALGSIIGILRNVASDLSPPAMLFTGFFGIFSALSIATALYILCPKAIKRFGNTIDNILNQV